MYTIFSKKLDTIIERADKKGIHSLSKKHQKLFFDHILEVEINLLGNEGTSNIDVSNTNLLIKKIHE